MRIVLENELNKSRNEIVSKSFEVCQDANFPVVLDDVYDHLFGSSDLISKFLINDDDEIVGFGVCQNYNLEKITFAYLQGMVISSKYQGKGYSKEMLRSLYSHFQSTLFGLRTQNYKMAISLLNLFKETLLSIPNSKDDISEIIKLIRQIPPYVDVDNNGIVRDCYYNQLYPNLDELKRIDPSIELGEKDALAVVVKPKILTR